jgi:spore germination protein
MRSVRGAAWSYLLLSVAFFGAVGFGWYQTNQKNKLAVDSENKYMSAFHQLKWTSENIEDRSTKLLATQDPRQQETLLADLRVFSSQAVDHMAVLPFSTMNTPHIESFFNTLRTRSDEYHGKVNRGEKLTDAELTQLRDMRNQTVTFERELGNLLGLVGSGHIRWGSTATAASPRASSPPNTPITQSVMMLDKALTTPPGATQSVAPPPRTLAKPQMDPGPRVTEAQAGAALAKFMDLPLKEPPKLTGSADLNDKTGELSLYFFDLQKQNGLKLNAGVSIHGGHVIYLIDGRPVTTKRLTANQLTDMGLAILKQRGYGDVAWVSYTENDGSLVIEYAPKQQGVAIYPDMIKLMLAMDNGEFVGFDARNYWINRHERPAMVPKLSAQAVLTHVASGLKVEGAPRLALIADRQNRERLTWEIHGHVNDQRFRTFLDATTGEEVDLIRTAGKPTSQ